MAEETDSPAARTDPMALALAAGAAGEEARDYLRKQSRIADLQIADMQREDRLRHWSLRVHHISDVMKLTFELTLALVTLAFVVSLAAVLWSAAHDDGLVIEAFKVPPDMAQKGLTGDVVASQLLDRLTDLQANTDSSRAPSTYSSGWGNDIKIEIPDTGISIGEAYRYLAGWLGNQTHISGEIYRTDTGIALTTRVSGHPGAHFEGSERDINALLAKTAEHVYGDTQPFRYAIYLTSHGRNAEGDAILRDLALNGPDSEKPWAYTVWAYDPLLAGDVGTALDRARKGAQLDPDLPLALNNLSVMEAAAGHEEREYQAALATRKSLKGSGARKIIPRAAQATAIETDAQIAEEQGDFREAVAQYETLGATADFEGSQWQAIRMGAADDALAHDISASRRLLGNRHDAEVFPLTVVGFGWQLPNFRLAQFEQAMALGDWRGARKIAAQILAPPEVKLPGSQVFVRAQFAPWLALAEAGDGDIKAAQARIGQTPLDCYLCLRMRGKIAAVQKNWDGAAYWFARSVAQAPSIPFAHAEWGTMLMAKGDFAGAIAQFTLANQKGPHYADPLEMWGEALMARNRSDLALAKFAEADKYAPNWGRLHLKWGEALVWSGDKAGAKAQFARASGLDLSVADKAELAKWMTNHG